MKIRQVGVYGLLRDAQGRYVTSAAGALPGGLVPQGEHPDQAVVRLVGEQTGPGVRITGLLKVSSSVVDHVHTDRILYSLAVGSVTGTASGIPPYPDEKPVEAVERRVQRFGAYAVARDPDGRVLLTKIAAGYPGAGLWHLPGGGTDHGETPEQGLTREFAEETSQHGRITGLLGTAHRYTPAELGPEGVPMDWHVIRVLFTVAVDQPTVPVVTEQGGSTEAAAWFRPSGLSDLPLTEVAREAVGNAALA